MVQGRRRFSIQIQRHDVALGFSVAGLVDSFSSWQLGLLLAVTGLMLSRMERQAGRRGVTGISLALSKAAIVVCGLGALIALVAARIQGASV